VNGIFEQALGGDFHRLHPRMRRRLSLSSAGGTGIIRHGRMERIWRGPAFTVPFLWLGATRHIMFPEQGRDIPFSIENYPYVDSHGRETVSFVRTFELARKRRRFDAQMVYSGRRGCVVDYLGTRQHLAVDLELGVRPDGGVRIRSREFRLREGPFRAVLPEAIVATAEVDEWFDESDDTFRIRVVVTHSRFGPVFGYTGWFRAHVVDLRPGVSGAVKPLREKVYE
jgi:hypothetical protein